MLEESLEPGSVQSIFIDSESMIFINHEESDTIVAIIYKLLKPSGLVIMPISDDPTKFFKSISTTGYPFVTSVHAFLNLPPLDGSPRQYYVLQKI